MNYTVGQVMTPEVYIIHPDTTLDEVENVFDSHDFHHLPVVQDGELVGMISQADLLLISNAFPLDDPERRDARNERLFSKILAEEIMTKHPVKLQPEMALDVAVGIFLENMFHALPVVDQNNQLVGILSTLDLLRLAYVPQHELQS